MGTQHRTSNFEPRTIEVCFSPVSFPLFKNENAIVVVIDILRATSAMCTAFHYGVSKIIPVATVEEALNYKNKGFYAAAERNGEIAPGFEIGNSPFSFMDPKLKGQTVVVSTTNGTQAIEVAKGSAKVTIGSFLNLDALSNWLVKQDKDVILLCAGWKNKFNLEDTLFAGAVVSKLYQSKNYTANCDSALASMNLYNLAKNDLFSFLESSSHRKRLAKLDLEKDIRYCLTLNQCPVIPILKGNELICE